MLVSFAIVAYNEEQSLPRLLKDLEQQDYPHDKIEVLLIDSMSQDNTRRIMQDFAAREHDFYRVSVFENTKKNIPSGHNVALKNYTGEALVRLDAHATMPSDFVRKNVEVLKSGEMASGGKRPNIIDEPTPIKETLLIAEQSMFGSSFAPYRRSEKKMYTTSLFCGMYKREVFDKVGLYNELLPRSEDNDMNERIRRAGFKLCYSPDIIYYQHTRNSLGKMLRQKFLNGYWIGKTMGINPRCFSLFHFIPFLFVLGILGTTVFTLLGFPYLAIAMWILYFMLIFGISAYETIKHKFSVTNLLLPALFFLLHLCYGIGTVVGLIELPFWLRKINK